VVGLDHYVLKLYADETRYRVAGTALGQLGVGGPVLTPGFLALLPELRATVQERLPGVSMFDPVATAPAAGALLAGLHTGAGDARPVFAPVSLLAAAAASASVTSRLLPHLGRRMTRLLADLEAAMPAGLPLVAAHGSFRAERLLDPPTAWPWSTSTDCAPPRPPSTWPPTPPASTAVSGRPGPRTRRPGGAPGRLRRHPARPGVDVRLLRAPAVPDALPPPRPRLARAHRDPDRHRRSPLPPVGGGPSR
jgi:hypothetical protein